MSPSFNRKKAGDWLLQTTPSTSAWTSQYRRHSDRTARCLHQGLWREDFRVFDDGEEQPVIGFLSIEEPAQVVLLLECGPAALFLKKSEFQAANTLLASISPVDCVAIVSYSRSPDLVVDFTGDKSEARAALRGMNFMAGFGELNLAPSVAAALDWLGWDRDCRVREK